MMGGDGGVVLEVLEHLVDGNLVVGAFRLRDRGHKAQGDRGLVGVEEAAADVAMGAIAHEEHRGALPLGNEEPILDDVGGKLEDLLDADGHLRGLRARIA